LPVPQLEDGTVLKTVIN